MNKIKKPLALLLSLLMLMTTLPLASLTAFAEGSEGYKAESHTFSTEWTVNSTGHWHVCTDKDCDITDYSTCGISGAAYGVHTGLTDDNTCDICGTVFYRPYEVSYTDSTIDFKVNVLDSVSEPYTKQNCDRFDAFMIAGNSGTNFDANMDFDHNGYYDAPHFVIKDPNNYTVNTATATGFCTKHGATYTITLNAANLEGAQYFSSDNPFIWIILRPCYSQNGMDYGYNSVNLTYANFYDCCICLGEFASLDDLHNANPTEDGDDDDDILETAKEEAIEDLEEIKEEFVSKEAKDIIDEAIEKIQKATDPDDIAVIKEETLEAAEKADEALETAKENAAKDLEEAKSGYVSDEAKDAIDKAIEDLEDAASLDEVAEIKENALDAADKADEALEEAIEDAKEALEEIGEEAKSEKAKNIIDEAIDALDDAKSLDEVAEIKEEAEEAAAAAEKELADTKEAAIETIEEAAGDDRSAALSNLVKDLEKQINAAATPEAVDSLLEKALDQIKYQQAVDGFSCPDDYHLFNYKDSITLLAESTTGKVVYTTSDPSVAAVDENGKVSAVGKGTCTVTATVEGTDISKDVEIEVRYSVFDVIIYYILAAFNTVKNAFKSIFSA